jgi:hypothetical protein
VGRLGAALPREGNAAGESPLGQVIADAQLAATRAAGAQLALMNPGGIRAALTCRPTASCATRPVSVQPFYNNLVTLTLSGAQLLQVLEQQWAGRSDGGRVLHVSQGFSYTWDARAPSASAWPGSVRLNGQPRPGGVRCASPSTPSWPAAATASRCSRKAATPSPASWTSTRWSLRQGQPDAGPGAAEPHHAAELNGTRAPRCWRRRSLPPSATAAR